MATLEPVGCAAAAAASAAAVADCSADWAETADLWDSEGKPGATQADAAARKVERADRADLEAGAEDWEGLAGLEGAAAQVEGLEARVIRVDLEALQADSEGCVAVAEAAEAGLAPWADWAGGWEAILAEERAAAAVAARGAATAAAAAMVALDTRACSRDTRGTRRLPLRSTTSFCPSVRILLCRPGPSTRCPLNLSLRATERSSALGCTCSEYTCSRRIRFSRACWRVPARRCSRRRRRRLAPPGACERGSFRASRGWAWGCVRPSGSRRAESSRPRRDGDRREGAKAMAAGMAVGLAERAGAAETAAVRA